MSTPSDAIGDRPAIGSEHRLHPLSWLFVLLQQLRSFAVPLIVLLVTGRGSSAGWLPLVGIAGLVLVSAIQYLTYRYRVEAGELVVHSGVLQRTRRDIPYERIHTVNLHQTLLHRLFGVVEVRLESAGGKEPEAVMRVLSMTDARALERLVRERASRGRDRHAERSAVEGLDTPGERLLALDVPDVVRLGLISNRGMVVVAAAAGAIWQFADDVGLSATRVPPALMSAAADARQFMATHAHDVVGLAVVAALVLLPVLAVVRLLSVGLALLQYFGFSVTETGRQLRIERGLLTRVRNQLPLRRIQAWRVDETLLHRWFGRQALRVDSAAGGDDDHVVRYLAPIATPQTIRSIVDRLAQTDSWPPASWQPVDARAWRRLSVVPALVAAAIGTGVLVAYGAPGVLPWLAIPVLVVRGRSMARFAGYLATDRTVAVRHGWLNRSWGRVEIRKLQTIRLSQSPFDRRLGMATLWLDTAGAPANEGVLRIPFLPVDEARTLHDRIARLMDQ